jgi:hypothetical protein
VPTLPEHFRIGAAPSLPKLDPLIIHGWEAEQEPDAVQVAFVPRDVRPQELLALPKAPIFVYLARSPSINIKWSATATNVNGVASGSFSLSTVGSTFTDEWVG